MKSFVFTIVLAFFSISSYSQAPDIVWKETFGGINDDAFYSVVNAHGSYAVGGVYRDMNNNAQSWIITISDAGVDFWQRKYIWAGDALISDLCLNPDYSYTVAGYTYEQPRNRRDLFYMRLTSEGSNLGKKLVGGLKKDGATSVIPLADGGNIIYGYFTNNYKQNLWAIRVNKLNTQYWKNDYNFSNVDEPAVAVIGFDKQLIFSSNLYSQNKLWDANFLFVNLETGTLLDTFTIGGKYNDWVNDVISTSDSSLVFCGYTELQDKAKDFWVVKTNYEGNIIWEKNFGWSMNEEAYSIAERYNGNLLLCGYTESKGNGMYDFWIMELDAQGNQLWEKTIGTDANDIAYDLTETDDGSIIVVGSIFNGANKLDGCVLKLK